MRTEKADQTRWRAAQSLVQIGMQGQKSAVPLLIEGLADRDLTVVTNCAVALAQVGHGAEAALPALERARQRPNIPNQKAIEEAIRTIRGK
jgi:HEAT repeat protein